MKQKKLVREQWGFYPLYREMTYDVGVKSEIHYSRFYFRRLLTFIYDDYDIANLHFYYYMLFLTRSRTCYGCKSGVICVIDFWVEG